MAEVMMMLSGKLTIWGACLTLLAIAFGLPVSSDSNTYAQAQIDVSGDWEVTLEGVLPNSCKFGVVQRDDSVFLGGGCTILTPVILEGDINTRTGEFSLSDSFGIAVSGQASKDGDTIDGTWSGLGFTGTLTGRRVDRTPHFVDGTGRWELELGPVELDAPSDAFHDSCVAEMRQSLGSLTAALDCVLSGASLLAGAIDPARGRFFLFPVGEADSFITQLDGVVGASGEMTGTFFAETELSGSLEGTRTSGPLGDADCNETVSSIDASIVLQLDAGLVLDIGCPSFADVTGDERVNSVDAVLILQHEAGLIISLAIGW